MADPLSIASSIVGILAAAGKITDILGPYISAVRETPRIAASVHSEVVGSRIILSALHGLLQTLSAASRSRTLLVPIDDLIAVFTNGVLIFSELESSITPICLDGADRIMGRIQWTRASGKLSDLLSRLQAFKQTTLLLLNILQWRVLNAQEVLSNKVLTILQNADMFRRLERLEDSFGVLGSIEPKLLPHCGQALPDTLSHDLACRSTVTQSHDRVCPAPESPLNAARQRSSSTPFEFQPVLDESLPYRRAQDDLLDGSIRGSVTTASKASSVFSGVSLSDVTVLSNVAIPVYPADISNAHHYQFMQPASAKVYTARRPNRLTVGKWAQAVRRIARPRELRFDIQFEVPVLFLCSPAATTGPLTDQPVVLINGSSQSLERSRVDLPASYVPPANGREVLRKEKSAMRTESSGRASWVDLLSALQRLELDSQAWDRNEVAKRQILPETRVDGAHGGPTLAVALQRKPGTWSTLPSHFKRPAASTTWGHIVALAAWLGMYWTDIDRSRGCYRAQGNGYAIAGSEVADLGTVFTFQVHGRSRFEENRVAPVAGLRELCFGFVPTIFHAAADDECRRSSAGFSSPNFSSKAEVAESLVALGCDAAAVRMFTEDGVVSHVYPVAFEVTGMLAQSFHIQNSGFKRLPNPTPYKWDTRAFSLPLMLEAFASQIRSLSAGGSSSVVQRRLAQYSSDLRELSTPTRSEGAPSSTVAVLDRLHYVIEKLDGILKAKIPGSGDQTRLAAVDVADSDEPRRDLVLLVLAVHVQGGGDWDGGDASKYEDETVDPLEAEEEAFLWRDVRSAPPEIRQHTLMRLYFDVVRPKVVTEVRKTMSPDREMQVASRAEDIWCTLVFRSICWLMLHDFHPMDVQIPKNDLYGSEVPVFIA
ncbi:modin [Colletotrichum sp. SAR 10_98]|nr:modin [Colletotrichum sp. SAR 10_98]